jgi:hypothetical protein
MTINDNWIARALTPGGVDTIFVIHRPAGAAPKRKTGVDAPMKFEIEKGRPLPPPHTGETLGLARTLAAMEVDDNFYIDGKKQNEITGQLRAWVLRHDPARKFATRKEGAGCRVWRTA